MRLAAKLLIGAALLVGGAATVIDLRASRREAAAEAAYPPEGRLIEIGGRRVHAVVSGTGPDLVLLHGAGGNTRDFTFRFVDQLSDRYRVIVFDRPGFGYTDRTDPRYARAIGTTAESPAEQAALLAAAAAELGATRPIVLGQSYGGAVAMAWALNHDPAAVVMVAGVSHPWPGGLGPSYTVPASWWGGITVVPAVAAFATPAQVTATISSIFVPQDMPEGYAAHIGAGLSLRRASARANARQVNTVYPHVVEMSARYPALTLPIEAVHGTADEIVPFSIHSAPLAERVASARLTPLDGIGHMPHHVAPDAVIAAIDRAADRAGLR